MGRTLFFQKYLPCASPFLSCGTFPHLTDNGGKPRTKFVFSWGYEHQSYEGEVLSQAEAAFDIVTKSDGSWVSHDQGSPSVLKLPQSGVWADNWNLAKIVDVLRVGGFSDPLGQSPISCRGQILTHVQTGLSGATGDGVLLSQLLGRRQASFGSVIGFWR